MQSSFGSRTRPIQVSGPKRNPCLSRANGRERMVTLSVVGKSWYREPWPWILMAGPLLVLAAGTMTVWLAIKSDDGLVAVDYYKRGLAINQETARARRAEQLGMAARAEVDGDAN